MATRKALASRLGGFARRGRSANDPVVLETKRELAEVQIAEAIEHARSLSPLSDVQIGRLIEVLKETNDPGTYSCRDRRASTSGGVVR